MFEFLNKFMFLGYIVTMMVISVTGVTVAFAIWVTSGIN